MRFITHIRNCLHHAQNVHTKMSSLHNHENLRTTNLFFEPNEPTILSTPQKNKLQYHKYLQTNSRVHIKLSNTDEKILNSK